MITIEQFKELYNAIWDGTEFELYFNDTENTYALIKYKDNLSFQRCGYSEEMIKNGWPSDHAGSKETFFTDLDELFITQTVDGILLRDDWSRINDIVVNSTYSVVSDKEEIEFVYDFKL